MAALLAIVSTGAALAIHAVIAPLVFAAIAWHYFRRGARAPLPTALGFAGVVAALDLVVVAGLVQRSAAIARSVAGFWLPLALIALAVWAVGALRAMLPFPTRASPA